MLIRRTLMMCGLLSVLFATSCEDTVQETDVDPGVDQVSDTLRDAPADQVPDTLRDAPSDQAPDALPDVPTDQAPDAPADQTGDTGNDADADVTPDVDTGPFQATLRLTNNSGASVWTKIDWTSWYAIQSEGTDLVLGSMCLCTCYYYPDCPMCEQPIPAVLEVPDGETLEYVWQGAMWEAEPVTYCYNEVFAAAIEYDAVFEWGTGFEEREWAPGVNAEYLTGEASETITFLLGTDEVIEHVIE